VQVVEDDFLITNAERVRGGAADGACNAVLVEPSQARTVTEVRAAFDAALVVGWDAIISGRSGEGEDVAVVHLAIGWGARQLKIGSVSRSERMKWNEVLRIEEALRPEARLAAWSR
jgi:enolase